MPNYRRIDTGEAVTADDPERGIWYPASELCGYWTDDWDKLSKTGGIPCCPYCGCVGMQSTYRQWMDGAQHFENDGHPHYIEFLNAIKETCALKRKQTFLQRYYLWLKQNAR